mgnify:CR=1 FL=1
MKKIQQLGIQSFCFRTLKDASELCPVLKDLGLNRLEVCAVHADFNDLPAWEQEVAIYKNHGIDVISIGVQTFTGDEAERTWFEAAALAGARHISAHFKVDSFTRAVPQVQTWCREFGIDIGIHNHGGYSFGGQPDVLRHLFELGGPEIGLCLDTAWCQQIGPQFGNPVEWVKEFGPHLKAYHLKDFAFERNGQFVDSVIGEGTIDLEAFIEALDQVGFSGLAILEYEGNPKDPVPDIRRCLDVLAPYRE